MSCLQCLRQIAASRRLDTRLSALRGSHFKVFQYLSWFAASMEIPGLIPAALMQDKNREFSDGVKMSWYHLKHEAADKETGETFETGALPAFVEARLVAFESDGGLRVLLDEFEPTERRADADDLSNMNASTLRSILSRVADQAAQKTLEGLGFVGGDGTNGVANGVAKNGFHATENGQNATENGVAPSRARRKDLTIQKESNDLKRSNVQNVSERSNDSEDFNFVVHPDSRTRSKLSRPSRQPDEYVAQVVALTEELRDWGSENGIRQLLSVCDQYGLPDLPNDALASVRRADRKQQLDKPGAYFRTCLVKMLGENGVIVTNKAQRKEFDEAMGLPPGATAEDRHAAFRATLPPLPGDEPAPSPAPPAVIGHQQISPQASTNGAKPAIDPELAEANRRLLARREADEAEKLAESLLAKAKEARR